MKFRLVEDSPRGQGVVCRTLIQILKLIHISVPEGDWVLHHKDGDHRNEQLDNLTIMSRSDHSSFHNTKNTLGWKPRDKTYDVKKLIDEFIQDNGSEDDPHPSEATVRELVGSAR